MSEMIERVAAAIYKEFENRPRFAQAQMNVIIAEECARAAVAAMREPNDEMLDAAYLDDGRGGDVDPGLAGEVYRAMIDAALSPAQTLPDTAPSPIATP